MKTLTNSALSTFKTCPRKYEIRYVKEYEVLRDSEPLFMGRLIHEGIEKWSKNKSVDEGLVQVRDILSNSETDEERYTLLKCMALLNGYFKEYDDEHYSIVDVEVPFQAPLLNPDTTAVSKTYKLEGKIDGIVKNEKGRLLLKEIKTTSEDLSVESDYWRRLNMDSQISTYYIGCDALGYNIEACLYDVIRKPTIRLKQSETVAEYYDRLTIDIDQRPDFYYARKIATRDKNELVNLLFDVWQTANSIREYSKAKKFPRYTQSCFTVFGQCKYWPVCSGQASLEDTSLYRKLEPNNELKENKKMEVAV